MPTESLVLAVILLGILIGFLYRHKLAQKTAILAKYSFWLGIVFITYGVSSWVLNPADFPSTTSSSGKFIHIGWIVLGILNLFIATQKNSK